MTQIGINTGPRHRRQLGLAKSYQATLSNEDCIAHDEDVNGAAGIFWSMILSMMPTEVTEPVVAALQNNSIPHFQTQFIEPGLPSPIFYTTVLSDQSNRKRLHVANQRKGGDIS